MMMSVYIYVCMYVCMYICMYACMHICMYIICMYVCILPRFKLQFFVEINSNIYVSNIKAYVHTPNNNFFQSTYLAIHIFSVCAE